MAWRPGQHVWALALKLRIHSIVYERRRPILLAGSALVASDRHQGHVSLNEGQWFRDVGRGLRRGPAQTPARGGLSFGDQALSITPLALSLLDVGRLLSCRADK